MKFQITSAGFAAAFAASNQGPEIKVSQFRVGSAFGYTPEAGDLSLRGGTLYSGTPMAYRVIDPNTCEFVCRMNEDVGTFDFGEVGLYLQDGTLFALGTLEQKQHKVAYPDSDFNRYNIAVRLTLSGAIPKIELTTENITIGVIWELPSVDDLPFLDDAISNVYLCHSADEVGNEPLCTVGADRWSISTHVRRRFQGNISATALGNASFTAGILQMRDSTAGRYLVQFTSGAAKGRVRRLTSIFDGVASFIKPEPNMAVGDSFDILQSTTAQGADSGDDAFFYSLIGK